MKFYIILFMYIFNSSFLIAQDKANSVVNVSSLKEKIMNQLNKQKMSLESFSIYMTIDEGADEKILVDVHSKNKLLPASITKIATSSAVLEELGPSYRFKTQILAELSKVKNNVLLGDLYLKGGGDPSFVSENMWYLVNAFLRSGVKSIEGDIVVDDSLFDEKRFDDSRESIRVDRAYDSPVGAMSFNWNSINIFVRPRLPNENVQVFLDPENEYVELINKAKTCKGNKNELIVERKSMPSLKDQIIIQGCLGTEAKEVVVYKNITNPDYWSGYQLKSFLQQRGVVLKGGIRKGITNSKAELVSEYESKSLQSIMSDMNKFSNNYVAEMLTKAISLKKNKVGNISDGVSIINAHLEKIGVPKEEFKIENPSGLTRKNYLSSYGMWIVLQNLKNHFNYQPEFLMSLPIAGVDGTLKKRLKNTPAEGWVRAKTGYLNGVVSLAGYAGRRDGRLITFSLLYNGPEDEAKIRSKFDSLIESAVE